MKFKKQNCYEEQREVERDHKRDINCNKHGDRNFVFRFVYGPLMADE